MQTAIFTIIIILCIVGLYPRPTSKEIAFWRVHDGWIEKSVAVLPGSSDPIWQKVAPAKDN